MVGTKVRKFCGLFNDKYIATRKIGEGGFGTIYELATVINPNVRFACKVEVACESDNLQADIKVLKKMTNIKAAHFPRCIDSGKIKNCNYLIMTLLGPSISELRKMMPLKNFECFTCACVAIQAIDALEELHGAGFIHRDVKPSNFAIGLLTTPEEKLVYLLDFGLARYYFKGGDATHGLRRPRRSVPFRGTTRYCSLNAHAREEQGRHDDLWSLLYMLVELHLGDLPWKSIDNKAEQEKRSMETELFERCPKEFSLYLTHIKFLSYGMKPDYALLRRLMQQWMRKEKVHFPARLDWERDSLHGQIFHPNKGWLVKNSKSPGRTPAKPTEVTLRALLKLPLTAAAIPDFPVITERDMCADNIEREEVETNTSADDTVDEGKEQKPLQVQLTPKSSLTKKSSKREKVEKLEKAEKFEQFEKVDKNASKLKSKGSRSRSTRKPGQPTPKKPSKLNQRNKSKERVTKKSAEKVAKKCGGSAEKVKKGGGGSAEKVPSRKSLKK